MVGVKSINSYHFQVHFYMTATPQYWIEDDNKPSMRPETNKPPYRVPSMAEINALPWNGLKVASTFSGAGGSCLGYRMAGFRVVWANEFVPAAQDSYRANAAPDCVLDCRDIRTVRPEEILAATGLAVGELDLFDGSPPCQAFSTAGKREKGWGKAKVYEHGASQCNETLFDEYVRLLRGLKPKVFVAENVSGLVKGTAKGYFLEILAALKASGYRVTCRVLDAQWLGVPQQRQRTIFVGVREDLGLDPVHPKPLPYRYSVRDALPWIVSVEGANGFNGHAYQASTVQASTVQAGRPLNVEAETRMAPCYQKEWDRMKVGEQSKKFFSLIKVNPEAPSPTVDTSAMRASVCHPTEKRKFTIAELRRICAFPDDFVLTGSYAQQWERLGNSVPPVMMAAIAREIRERVLTP
jgi:DNA (cytosine-5)-methyltransferase 1